MNAKSAKPYAVRVAGFYGALFAYIGIYIPFFPPFLAARGLTPVEIGLVMALPLLARILATPVVTWLADRSGRAPAVLFACACGVLMTTAAFLLTHDFLATAIVACANAMCLNPLMPLSEALALRGVRVYALDYGRMRLVGSLTFIIANVAGGFVLASAGAGFAIWLLLGAAAMLVAAGFRLPQVDEPLPREQRPTGFLATMRAAANPLNLVALGGFALVFASHNQFYVFGTVHWAGQGIGSDVAGALWAVGVLAEVALFAWSGAIGGRIGASGLLALGAAAGVLRWAAMAFDPPLGALFALQALHGLSFGATHLGAIRFLAHRTGAGGANSLQGLYYMLTGVCSFAANAAAGPLYQALAGASYAVMAVLAAIGGILALAALARVRGEGSAP